MLECINRKKNLANCPCTYEPCGRKGMCCECLRHHLERRELPACCFSSAAERSFDRSFEKFIATTKGK